MANGADVSNREQVNAMVEATIEKWGRIDVLVNNAGILRDRSFGKMTGEEWDAVIAVHLTGSANCTLAVWNQMKQQNYGRIVMTTSTSGIYGNFGQANYGAAKTGVWGMMNTLHIEGAKNNIHVNCISPTAATRMTEDVIPPESLAMLDPKFVTPAVIFLASKEAPSRNIVLAGAGGYTVAKLMEAEGVYLSEDKRTAENIAAQLGQDDRHERRPRNADGQRPCYQDGRKGDGGRLMSDANALDERCSCSVAGGATCPASPASRR